MTITIDQLQGFGSNGKVLSNHGEKVGSIGQIYVDDETGEPTWVTVRTGLFGTAESFVPLQSARIDGDDVVVGYDKETIKAAPRLEADGSLSPDEEQTLYRHYGLGVLDDVTDLERSPGRTVGTGHDQSGPTTDSAMTVSEERLRVGTQSRESGRARLRKYVVTEQVSQTIPLRHEEVRLEREPITDANRGAAVSGQAFSEEEHVVVLHEEVPVVEKKAVAVERVRLDKTTVTARETVSADLRKERVELDERPAEDNTPRS